MKTKKLFATALLGLGLTLLPFTSNAVDKEVMDKAVEKTICSGKFASSDSGSGYEVFLDKKEKIGENEERCTYLTVHYTVIMIAEGPRILVEHAWLVIDDWKQTDDGCVLEQKIMMDGSDSYGPPDGTVDYMSEERVVQDSRGFVLSYDSKKADLTDEKTLEEVQRLFDKNIEYFLNN